MLKLGMLAILLALLAIIVVVCLTHERLRRIEERLSGPTTKEVKVPPQT